MGDMNSEVLAFLRVSYLGGSDTITEPENDLKVLMPVFRFHCGFLPPWEQSPLGSLSWRSCHALGSQWHDQETWAG
jgi:hypothetical protein